MMASSSLRRALLTYRNIAPIFRSSRHLSFLPSNSTFHASAPHNISISPPINSLFQIHRGFAKGRKQRDDDYDDGGTLQVVNIGPSVKAAALSQMEAAIDALSRDLSKLRTGRASTGMLDHIVVESGGVRTLLGHIAIVSALDSKTLSVTPYDPGAIKELEKAIVSSPLGLNPKVEGERLIAVIPPLTKEHMQAVCKVVAKASEDVKQSIRRARQKALDTIKKSLPNKKEKSASGISADDAKKLEKDIDEITKRFTKSAEDMCKAKEKEITES